jgi:chromosome segregation ATPase
VDDRDPIKQLQHLLDDPGKVLERISRIQSALGSINTPNSEARPAVPVVAEARPTPKNEDDSYRHLLQTLRDIQSKIEGRVRPLALQAVQAEADRLTEWVKREQRALEECLARIDENLLTCVDRIKESQSRYVDLTALKKRLEELGAPTRSLPEFSVSQDPSQIITARLDSLRRDGKI